MMRVVPAVVLEAFLGLAAHTLWRLCLELHRALKVLEPYMRRAPASPYAGKTVLVTTGRQAKTLHTVRALKELGCRVVVTDYQEMSASAVSTACDARATLEPLNPLKVGEWVDKLEQIIVREKVDLVVPISTINECLFIGVAKDWLAGRLPHVQFCCPGLKSMVNLDNKPLFADMCRAGGVPVPEDGVVTCVEQLTDGTVPFGEMDIIIKRVESTINREEEIKIVPKGGKCPTSVKPTAADPWQWQRCIKGTEYSAWFICIDGKVTFEGCYRSEADLLFFDGMAVPADVSKALEGLIAKQKLTGQFAFDYFREESTEKFYVIECNPRSSSVLEGVSGTPGWGAAFFGIDMRKDTKYQQVGFCFHRNCWPFVAERVEGFWSFFDPLPFLVAEVAWPLEMLRTKGALQGGSLPREPIGIPIESGIPLTAQYPRLMEQLGLNYHHIDVNIGKVIVPGPTSGRDFAIFEKIVEDSRNEFVRAQPALCGSFQAPRVLCADAEIAGALAAGLAEGRIEVTRLSEDPVEAADSGKEQVLVGSPGTTMRALAEQQKIFDLVFLPKADMLLIPETLLASGARVVPVETMPRMPWKPSQGCHGGS